MANLDDLQNFLIKAQKEIKSVISPNKLAQWQHFFNKAFKNHQIKIIRPMKVCCLKVVKLAVKGCLSFVVDFLACILSTGVFSEAREVLDEPMPLSELNPSSTERHRVYLLMGAQIYLELQQFDKARDLIKLLVESHFSGEAKQSEQAAPFHTYLAVLQLLTLNEPLNEFPQNTSVLFRSCSTYATQLYFAVSHAKRKAVWIQSKLKPGLSALRPDSESQYSLTTFEDIRDVNLGCPLIKVDERDGSIHFQRPTISEEVLEWKSHQTAKLFEILGQIK